MSSSGPTCSDLPPLVASFADAFVDFCVSGLFFPSNPSDQNPKSPTTTTSTTTFLPPATRLVAIGDLHGDFQKSLSALRLAGVVGPTGSDWSGGAAVAVQVGDVLDRGGDELRLLYLLRHLRLSAAAAGGALVPVLGNHEVMNVAGDFRFATASGLAEFSSWARWYRAGLSIKRRCPDLPLGESQNPFLGVPKTFPGIKQEYWDGLCARIAALRPSGPISRRFLAPNPAVLVVGDSVFVHGGLLEGHVEYGIERINEEVRDWIMGKNGEDRRAPKFVRGSDSVVWLRRFSEGFDCDCGRLEGVLGMIPGAKRMVMGHTIQSEGINAVCGTRAVRVDVGLSRGCGDGKPEVLEINGGGDEVRVLTADPKYDLRYRERGEAAREEVKDGLAWLLRESSGMKEVEAKA